jgi:hypothetical protein
VRGTAQGGAGAGRASERTQASRLDGGDALGGKEELNLAEGFDQQEKLDHAEGLQCTHRLEAQGHDGQEELDIV